MPKPKLVFQIAYDHGLMFTRGKLLERRGYEVISALGNQAAKQALLPRKRYDLFILGHAAPEKERLEMAQWLKDRFPKTKILALNPPHHPRLGGADFNVELNGPEAWLAVVSAI